MAKKRESLIYGTTMVALLAGGPALGQSAVTVAPSITVTATSNPMSTFDYPGSVTVVGSEEIETKIPSTPHDVMKDVPNVTFSGGPRRTGEVPIIRGFSGQDVIVLLDGTRQNYISGHDGRFYLDPALLKQVEVVRGASSALYGSGGLGGVIEFTTKDAADFLAPGETAGVSVFMGYQSVNNEYSPGITLFANPAEGLDMIGSFVYRDSGDIQLGGGGELSADDDILSGLAKVSFTEGPHRIEGSWTRYDASAIEPNNGQDPLATDYVDKDLMAETWRLAYSFNEPGNDWLDLDAQFYYTRYKADETRLVDTDTGPAGELLTRDLDTIGLRIDNRSRISLGETSNMLLTYGVEAYRDKQTGEQGSGVRGGVPDATSTFYGLFAQAEITFEAPLGIPGDFLVIPGLRYDNYRSTSDLAADNKDDALSPKIGVSYLPTDWLMFYGSYAHAFSAPNLNDIYAGGQHFDLTSGFDFPPFSPIPPGSVSNYFVPNPDLKPQTTRTFELGMGVEFEDVFWRGDQMRAKGGYFHTIAEDLISFDVNQPLPFYVGGSCVPYVPGSCLGTTTVVNVANAKLQGFEIEGGYENEYFLVELAYGHINGIDRDTGEPIGSLQPDTLSFHIAGKLPQIDTRIGWRVTAADDFTATSDPEEERDGYVVQDIYAIWAPRDGLLEGVSVALGIDNVTDTEYSLVYTGANEAGRNYKAMVSYTVAW